MQVRCRPGKVRRSETNRPINNNKTTGEKVKVKVKLQRPSVRSSPPKRSGIWITQFLHCKHTPYLHSPRKRSQAAPPLTSNNSHLIAAYYSFIDRRTPEGWKAELAKLADLQRTHQLQVRCRSETDVLPLSYHSQRQSASVSSTDHWCTNSNVVDVEVVLFTAEAVDWCGVVSRRRGRWRFVGRKELESVIKDDLQKTYCVVHVDREVLLSTADSQVHSLRTSHVHQSL